MADIKITHLFSISLKVHEIQNLGQTPLGNRRVAVVEGGSFEGPKLKGTVLRGGSDWILVRPDGALHLDVRLTLSTHDGELIGMTYRGFRHGPAATIERLSRRKRRPVRILFPRRAVLRDSLRDVWLAQPHCYSRHRPSAAGWPGVSGV